MNPESFFSIMLHRRVMRHFFFWIAVLLTFIIVKASYNDGLLPDIMLLNSVGLIVPVLATYFLNYYLVPEFYQKKKYFSFFLLLLFTTYIFSVFARLLMVHVVEPIFRRGDFSTEPIAEIIFDYEYLLRAYFAPILMVSFFLFFLKQQIVQRQIKERNLLLKKEKAEAELNFLKAQIHPHFLFNTLNSLYVLCLKKSEKAPQTVIQLSEILDYILYH